MRAWFESLQPRERVFVAAAAAVLLIAVFWLGVWLPLDRGHRTAAAGVDLWRESLAELRSLKGQLKGADAGVSANDSRSLVLIMDSTLREHGLYSSLQSSQPGTNNDITVTLTEAAFDDLVLWLGEVSAGHGLQIRLATFNPASEQGNGRVDSQVTLER